MSKTENTMHQYHRMEIDATFRECDPTGRVHHASLIEWGERGRIALLANNGITYELVARWEFIPATVSIEAKFSGAMKPWQKATLHTHLTDHHRYKLKTTQTIEISGIITVARIVATTAFFTPDGEVRPLPEAVYEALEAGAEIDIAKLEAEING